MLHHLTYYHITDRHKPRDKLESKAFDHLLEIRHLLQQTTDRRIFSIVRSSSDSLPNTAWRGNKANSGTKSFIMDTINALDRSTIERKQRPMPAPTSLSRPPTNRSNQVNNYSPLSLSMLHMINTGLSLNLDHTNSPNSTPRLEYAKGITETTDTPFETPIDTVTNEVNTHQKATASPRTRNGGVRKGTFDRHHNFRRNCS